MLLILLGRGEVWPGGVYINNMTSCNDPSCSGSDHVGVTASAQPQYPECGSTFVIQRWRNWG